MPKMIICNNEAVKIITDLSKSNFMELDSIVIVILERD
jgi:hypothetical protein